LLEEHVSAFELKSPFPYEKKHYRGLVEVLDVLGIRGTCMFGAAVS
jgi:hypothetical protein